MLAAASGLGVPADDGVLTQMRLDLQPRRTSQSLVVTAPAILGDHPFEPLFGDRLEEGDASLLDMVAQTKVAKVRQDAGQEFLAPEQGQAAEIVPVQVQQVEHYVNQHPLLV